MAFNISQFAAQALPLGGARNAYFSVIVDTPSGVPNIGARMAITCKAASLPGSSVVSIPIRYFGREIKLAGSRVFQPWIVTILNDEDFQIRQALETWSNLINKHEQNVRDPILARNSDYRTTATVTQYSKTGVPIRTYQFVNIWPTEISPIETSWDNAEAIEEFTCTFDYDYWKPVAPGTTGSFTV